MNSNSKIVHFKFLKSLNVLLVVASILSILLVGALILIFSLNGTLSNSSSVDFIVFTLLTTLPLVLFVLCVVGFAIFSKELSKNNVYVNHYSHLETLLNIDVLCLEKTGVITDGNLEIKKIIPLSTKASEQYLSQWISNYMRAFKYKDPVFNALRRTFDLELTAGIVDTLYLNEKIGYSGVSFTGGKTFVLGDFQIVPIANKTGILKRCEEFIKNGHQVLVFGEGKEQITENGYPGELEVLALIILKDHIRDSAFETFKLLKNNGTVIKVISSEDALSTSAVASEAGIENADKYISLEAMGEEEIRKAAKEYTVFGRVNAGQKQVLINAFKEEKQTVCVIGSNHNDLAAMNSANFSIATNNSDADVKNDADIILMDKSFKILPSVINASNLFINSLSKVVSFLLAKNIFAFVIALLVVVIAKDLPFTFTRFLLFDLLVYGVASFFVLIDINNEKIKEKFLPKVLKEAIPVSIMLSVAILLIYVFYLLQSKGLLNLGIYTVEVARAMSIITYSALNIFCFFKLCFPFNKPRTIIFASATAVITLVLIALGIVSGVLNITEPVLQISFIEMNAVTIVTSVIIIVIFAALYLFINRIIDIRKGDNLEDED